MFLTKSSLYFSFLMIKVEETKKTYFNFGFRKTDIHN